MDGKWIYSAIDIDWSHDTYDTKEEALNAAKTMYENSCYVGQLKHQNGINYKIINAEKIMF